MLTGDKLETATCTAKNAHLVTRTQDIHIFRLVSDTHVHLSRPVQVTKFQDRRGAEIRALFLQKTQTIYVFFDPAFYPLEVLFISVLPAHIAFAPFETCLFVFTPTKQTLPPCPVFLQVTNRGEAHLELNAFRRKHDCALVISGDSLEVGCELAGLLRSSPNTLWLTSDL